MPDQQIKTYSTEGFKDKFMIPGQKLDTILKMDFGKFFIVPVQDMIRLIKLPVPPMRSSTHTFIYLTAGEAVLSIGSETFTIYKNECLFVPAGQVFSFNNVDANKGYLINFHSDFITTSAGKSDALKRFEFLNVWGNPCIKLSKPTGTYVLHLLKRIYADYVANGLKNSDILQASFIALLCEVKQDYSPISNSINKQSLSLTHRFKKLVFENVRKKHLVTDYANMLNITPNHLNKVVKQITGKSPTKWIDEALMLDAKVLLYQTEFTIAQVAAELNLQDPSYFSRLFKKYEGVTPVAFRKMIEKS